MSDKVEPVQRIRETRRLKRNNLPLLFWTEGPNTLFIQSVILDLIGVKWNSNKTCWKEVTIPINKIINFRGTI